METKLCILHGLKYNNKALGIISSLPLANQSGLGLTLGTKPLNNNELQVKGFSKFWQAISAHYNVRNFTNLSYASIVKNLLNWRHKGLPRMEMSY